MTDELYEQVKDKIPKHVGVYTNWCIKKPKKVELGLEHEYLNVLYDEIAIWKISELKQNLLMKK